MRHFLRRSALIVLPLVGACSLFGRGGAAAAPAAEPAAPAAPSGARASAPTPGLTDANIAAIVVAANNADINYAELALAKSQDPDVRGFATMARSDHQGVNRVAGELLAKLKVTPVDNQLSFDIRDDAETKRLTLRDFEGFAFDSAYATNEVGYHKTLLGAIDAALIPSARNAELKALLIQVRPAVEAHLGHAEQLMAKKTKRR